MDGDTLVLSVVGKPGASRNAMGKVQGKRHKVSVTSAPQAVKATEQLVRFLAESSGSCPASKLSSVLRARTNCCGFCGVLPERTEWPARTGLRQQAAR